MAGRHFMTISSTPSIGSAQAVHLVTYGAERFSVSFRGVDPVVEVRGVLIAWQTTLCMSNGSECFGYGATQAASLRSAFEDAVADGALIGVELGVLMHAFCTDQDQAPSIPN